MVLGRVFDLRDTTVCGSIPDTDLGPPVGKKCSKRPKIPAKKGL